MRHDLFVLQTISNKLNIRKMRFQKLLIIHCAISRIILQEGDVSETRLTHQTFRAGFKTPSHRIHMLGGTQRMF